MHDVHGGRHTDRHTFFRSVKVSLRHAGHPGQTVGRPRSHAVRVLLGVGLDGTRRPPVAVAFPQHRVHCRTLDLVVPGLHVLIFFRARIVGVVGQVKSQRLQLGNGRFKLRNGGADVGKLDNVGVRGLGQRSKLSKCILCLLFCRKQVRHGRQNAAAE